MAENFIHYVKQSRSTFEEAPLNEVDAAIFAQLSYLYYPEEGPVHPGPEGIAIGELWKSEWLDTLVGRNFEPAATRELIAAVTCSPRFRDLRIFDFEQEYSPEENTQFAAMTFSIRPGASLVAFRGTDRSLTGWKEDMLLAQAEAIPAQTLSLRYLEQAALHCNGELIVCGHSKGGNLAVFSAAHCSTATRERISGIYSFDGPGFKAEDLEYPGFELIRDRLHKLVPQSSMVGMLFEQECAYDIIHSRDISVRQHSLFSWEYSGESFIRRENLSPDAQVIYRRMNSWIENLGAEDQKNMTMEVFSILEKTGAETFAELTENSARYLPVLLRELKNMAPETRKFLTHVFGMLITGKPDEKQPTLPETTEETKDENKA